eukprot:TRINITY_DN554_c0_g2_i2.p1 TRINITY_DN554_c0_g2~~TRINITY_DN554_c0_g2_i2.p1  ORF type:complete len:588 (+),score=210.19 TRINITY_DN554_c0_g2_i2:82-1845(+)
MLRRVGALALLAAAAHAVDPCVSQTDCAGCVAQTGCGWCSTKIVFQDGTTGSNCAGPKYEKPFSCNGIYSTQTCTRGYVCDTVHGGCKEVGPGQGVPKATCDATCKAPAPPPPPAKVYSCDNATLTCKECAPGTPGSSSLEVCNQTCKQHPPSPPTPPAPTADVYSCDAASAQCVKVAPGTPGSSSKEVCDKNCVSSYKCDTTKFQCVKQTGAGPSLADCQKVCKSENDPCEQHFSCTSCLSASPECGWCSSNVTYENGKMGTQCAGVGPGIEPFACNGQYSTDKCIDGFMCDTATGKCVDAGPGKGVPIDQCRDSCKAPPTPKPTPMPTPKPTPKPTPAPPPAVVCSTKLDIMFLFDASTSITSADWKVDLESAQAVANTFTFGADKAAAGIVEFGTVDPCYQTIGDCCETGIPGDCGMRISTPSHLTQDKQQFLSTLSRVKQTGGGTPTGKGIDAVVAEFQKNGRPGSHKVCVTITDGEPNVGGGESAAVSSAKKLKDLGATHIVIVVKGADGVNMRVIDEMASTPSSKYVLVAKNWKDLPSKLQEIIDGICKGEYKCNSKKQCQQCQPGESGCLPDYAACDAQC